jgi:hypothetical protein
MVKNLFDYGTDNCNSVCLGVSYSMRHQMASCWFLCFSSGLTCGLLKNHRNPKQFHFFMHNTSVQYQFSSIIAMSVSQELLGDYKFPTNCSKDILHQAKGELSWSSPLSSQGSQTGGTVGRIKRATLMVYLLKKRELDNSSKPNRTRARGRPPEKNTT